MNYYELLGIDINASDEEIKQAYKQEIKKWHPDINKDEKAIDITIKLNEAKETLLDKGKREEYNNYLINKEDKVYEKYTNVKTNNYEYEVDSNEYEKYEEKMVTKWQYLYEFLRFNNISFLRRIIGLIFVLLESLLCYILKCFIVLMSYLCFIISNLIILLFKILLPLYLFVVCYLIFIYLSKGYDILINEKIGILYSVIIYVLIFIIGLILPIIGNKLISQKVFDLLYNKLDVYLFKKAVGYK